MRRPSRTLAVLASALVLAAGGVAGAAPGDLDATFSGDGWLSVDTSDPGERLNGVALTGTGGYACGTGDGLVAVRFRRGGAPHADFGNGGVVTRSFGAFTSGSGCVVLDDGRLAVVGSARDPARLLVAVFRPDGTLSRRFSKDGRVLLRAPGWDATLGHGIVQRPDGRLVIVGQALGGGGNEGVAVVLRLRLDGRIDRTFARHGWRSVNVRAGEESLEEVTLDADGRVVASGYAEDGAAAPYDTMLVRLTPAGRLDDRFSGDGVFVRDLSGDGSYDEALGLDVRRSGAVVASAYDYDDGAGVLFQLTPRGRLDPVFAGDGTFTDFPIVSPYRPEDVDIVPGLGIVLTGFVTSGPTATVTIVGNLGGGMRTSFGGDGVVQPDDWGFGGRFMTGAIDGRGRLVAVGDTGQDLLVARLET